MKGLKMKGISVGTALVNGHYTAHFIVPCGVLCELLVKYGANTPVCITVRDLMLAGF